MPSPLSLKLRVACDYEAVRRAAAQVRTFLAAQHVTERDLWACELAFVEGCNNAVRYTPPARQAGGIIAEVSRKGTELEFRIDDHSAGFDLPNEPELPPQDQESGRGLYLIKTLMDRVDYSRGESNNCLILRKTLTGI